MKMLNTLKNNTKKTILLSVAILTAVLVLTPSLVYAQAPGAAPVPAVTFTCSGSGPDRAKCEACRGSGGTSYVSGGACVTNNDNPEARVSGIIETVINIFSFVVGITSVLMIMIGGFKYITSQGDANSITSAKNTILYAVIGLVIVLFAQVIVKFVISKV